MVFYIIDSMYILDSYIIYSLYILDSHIIYSIDILFSYIIYNIYILDSYMINCVYILFFYTTCSTKYSATVNSSKITETEDRVVVAMLWNLILEWALFESFQVTFSDDAFISRVWEGWYFSSLTDRRAGENLRCSHSSCCCSKSVELHNKVTNRI